MTNSDMRQRSLLITKGIGAGIAGVLLSVAAIGPAVAAAAPTSNVAAHSAVSEAAGSTPVASAERQAHGPAKVRHGKKHHKKRVRHKAKKATRATTVAVAHPKPATTVSAIPTRTGTLAGSRPVPTPPAPSLAALGTLTNVVGSNLNLQQAMLTGLVAQRSDTSRRPGFSALPAATQSALTSLPYLATAGVIRTNTGPALTSASVSLATGSVTDRTNAINAFDTLLSTMQRSDGAIAPLPTGGDIDTMFFTANLGVADLILHSQLDAAHQASWDSAVSRAADYLINNGNLRWYTNGNVTIGNALVEALAYRITGQPRFLAAYNTAWDFATSPNQVRWPGMGFQTTRQPASADGSDGAGYFTEAGQFLGFDPDYSMVQSELLSRLYVLTRDPRVLVALNMVINQLMGRVTVSSNGVLMDGSNGSRHNYVDPMFFDSSGLQTLAYLGGREDLVQYTYAQTLTTYKEFTQSLARHDLSDRGMWALGAITGTIAWVSNPVGAASSYEGFVNRS